MICLLALLEDIDYHFVNMVFAVNIGVIEHNKLAGIGKAFETAKVTNQASLKPEKLSELLNALSYASIKLLTRCLIEWQLHTMTRPSIKNGNPFAINNG